MTNPRAGHLTATLKAWAELARISNLPTVWANVLTGAALAAATRGIAPAYESQQSLQLAWRALPAMAAICLFYIAGMMLNDLADLRIDRQERPSRPLPSGRIKPAAALLAVVVLFFAGAALLLMTTRQVNSPLLLAAGGLVAAIVLYDLTHKLHAATVLIMGACRGLVYLTAAAYLGSPLQQPAVWLFAGVLTFYTVAISLVARSEVQGVLGPRRHVAILMPLAVLAMVGCIRPANMLWPGGVGMIMTLWLTRGIRFVNARPPRVIAAVLTWLSGMALVDAYFLALLGHPTLSLIAAGCAVLTSMGHRRIMGT
jgi:4-hydroxybenzoate polyprenyltransferase